MAELALGLGAAAAATSVVGGVASITQGRAQAEATEAAGRYNAAVALTEAAVAEERLRRDRSRRQGALRAAMGGRGVQLSGTPLEILADRGWRALVGDPPRGERGGPGRALGGDAVAERTESFDPLAGLD